MLISQIVLGKVPGLYISLTSIALVVRSISLVAHTILTVVLIHIMLVLNVKVIIN